MQVTTYELEQELGKINKRISYLESELEFRRDELGELETDCIEIEEYLYKLDGQKDELEERLKQAEKQEELEESPDYINPKWLEQEESLFDDFN